VLHLLRVLRALKHHVLKKVREPAPALWLESESDLVVHPDRHDRRRGIRGDNHAQAILECRILDWNLKLRHA